MTTFRFCGKKRISLKTVSNLFLVFYILLCLTAGGLHNKEFRVGSSELGVIGLQTPNSELTTHNADTCLVCQWLKNPTTKVHITAVNWQLLPVISGSFHYNNTLPHILHVNNFFTRAPPASFSQ